jgi:hypothetical protein
MRSKVPGFLAAGVVGVAALLLGQAWDFYLHAADPTLAHREGIFALTNPGHLLLGVGLVLVVVGVLGAAYSTLPLGHWWRRSFLMGFLALIIASGATAGWAASIELSAQQRLNAADHQQALSAGHPPGTGAGHAGSAQLLVRAAQLQAANRLYEQTRAAVQRYRDLAAAIAAGYQPMEPPDLEIAHYVNRAYFTDQDILKPEHVQSLIYFNTKKGPVLIGAMYIMPRWGMPGPQIGGALTTWHQHNDLCFDKKTNMVVAFAGAGGAFLDRPGWSRSCPPGSSKQDTPEMLHVWLIDNPNGPFDTDMDPADVGAILAASASK